jgi:BASS family bile acid:Na+ symporter
VGRYFDQPFAMSAGTIAKAVLLTILVPLAAGLAVGAKFPAFATRLARPVSLVSNALLAAGALVILLAVIPAMRTLIGNGTILAMAAFVVAGLIAGHYLGGPVDDDRTVLALSAASRHPAIALAIAKANFPDEPFLGATIVLYLLVNAIVCLPCVSRHRRAITESAAS